MTQQHLDKCGTCDYESEDESIIKEHMNSDHVCTICGNSFCSKISLNIHIEDLHGTKVDESEGVIGSDNFECETCGLVYATEEKLKKHMCRITIKNPSFCDLYVKNWIAVNICNLIYHRIEKSEVAILHCQACIDNTARCGEKFPTLWLPAQEDTKDGVWHLDRAKFLKDGRLDWQAVKTLVKRN